MSRRNPSTEGSEQDRIREVNDAMSQLVAMNPGYNPPRAEYGLAKRAADGDSDAREKLQRQLETLCLVAKHAQGEHQVSSTPAYAKADIKQLDEVMDSPSSPTRSSARDLQKCVERAARELNLNLSV